MRLALRLVRLLAVVLWVGGLCFFGAVTYVAFNQLGSTHLAGIMVRGTLNLLHRLGILCGAGFLMATALLWMSIRRSSSRRLQRLFVMGSLLALAMTFVTAYSSLLVLPKMEQARLALGGDVAAAPTDAREAVEFQHLHGLSVRLETAVLGCGLLLLVVLAAEEHGQALAPGRIVSA